MQNLVRYGTAARVHLPNEDGLPLCERKYNVNSISFRKVEREANCQKCLQRRDGIAARETQEAPAVSAEQLRYRQVVKLIDRFVQLSTPSEEGLNPAELNVLRHKVNGAAVTALDALLTTGIYAELRIRAGEEN